MTPEFFQEQYEVLHRPLPMFGSGVAESLAPVPEADFHRAVGHRTIAQLIGHIVAWRRNTALRLRDEPRPKIELNSPEDWPDYSRKSKAEMVTELQETKAGMIAAFAAFDYNRINEKLHPDHYYTFRHVLDGAVQHDIYHLGQINLLAALLRNTPQVLQ